MHSARSAVSISGLRVRRGRNLVLDDFGVEIERGRLTGLLGPSGSGKTTLMRAIVGVQQLESGRVDVLGASAGSPSLRRRIGYVTQSPAVYADLTVEQNLRYFARVLGLDRESARRAMNQVGLEAYAGTMAESLSGGELNRVSLAAGLLGQPELLVLDEPTVGLDPVLREQLWTLFRGLAATGVTLIVSSHVMDEAMRCDRLLLLRDGRSIADTTPAELLASTDSTDPESAFLRLIERDVAQTDEGRS